MSRKDHLPFFLLCLFIVIWLLLAINPHFRGVWIAENILTVSFLIFLIITYNYFRLSNKSYLLLFGFMLLHVIGSYYAYSEVPLFTVFKETFDLARNHYDRVVHLLFGIIFFIPLREFSSQKLRLSSQWSNFFAFVAIVALKGMFEVIEYGWLLVTRDELIGIMYLGMQGDAWDAQKDIFWGMVGAAITWTGYALWERRK